MQRGLDREGMRRQDSGCALCRATCSDAVVRVQTKLRDIG